MNKIKELARQANEISGAVNMLDDVEYQKFLEDIAKTCSAEDKPCAGCMAGAPCDGGYESDWRNIGEDDWE